MFKKAVLMVFATMLLVAGAGMASATQVGGMASGNGTGLPAGLTVHVNPAGLGDGLIYGYYNARNALTFFRIVNTSTTHAVKARVRFREAKTSAEILDFNVCLSNKDQWSAWILSPTASGPAVIIPVDGGLMPPSSVTLPDTITAPKIKNAGEGGSGQAFKCDSGAGCTSTVAALKNVTAADTQEGYWEVIGEASIDHVGTVIGGEDTKINFNDTTCLESQGRHDGVAVLDVPNVLGGDASVFVVRPEVSGLFSYNATALADCRLTTDFSVANESPDWNACVNGQLGVDYVLTKQDHIAMFNVEGWDKAQTEVIVNFPTKSKHDTGSTTAPFSTKPFTFGADRCQPITLNLYNDLQDTTTTQTDFSPASGPQGASLCNEVNVVKVNTSDILDSNVEKTLDVTAVTPFTGLGWVRIGLNTGDTAGLPATCATHSTSVCFPATGSTHETYGLPSIGYVLTDFLGSMGQMNETKYFTNVATPAQ